MARQQVTENKRSQCAVLTVTVAHLSHDRAHVKFNGANTVRFAAFGLFYNIRNKVRGVDEAAPLVEIFLTISSSTYDEYKSPCIRNATPLSPLCRMSHRDLERVEDLPQMQRALDRSCFPAPKMEHSLTPLRAEVPGEKKRAGRCTVEDFRSFLNFTKAITSF